MSTERTESEWNAKLERIALCLGVHPVKASDLMSGEAALAHGDKRCWPVIDLLAAIVRRIEQLDEATERRTDI